MNVYQKIMKRNCLYEFARELVDELELPLREILSIEFGVGNSVESGNCTEGTKRFCDETDRKYTDIMTVAELLDHAALVKHYESELLDTISHANQHGLNTDYAYDPCPQCGDLHDSQASDYGEFCCDVCYCDHKSDAESYLVDGFIDDLKTELEDWGFPDWCEQIEDIDAIHYWGWFADADYPETESYYGGEHDGWIIRHDTEQVASIAAIDLADQINCDNVQQCLQVYKYTVDVEACGQCDDARQELIAAIETHFEAAEKRQQDNRNIDLQRFAAYHKMATRLFDETYIHHTSLGIRVDRYLGKVRGHLYVVHREPGYQVLSDRGDELPGTFSTVYGAIRGADAFLSCLDSQRLIMLPTWSLDNPMYSDPYMTRARDAYRQSLSGGPRG